MNQLKDLYDVGLWVIRQFTPSISVYVVVSKNYIKVINLENETTVSAAAEQEFSTSRLLMADPIIAEKLARSLISRVCSAAQLKTRRLFVICHPLDKELGNLSPAEKMNFTDFVYHIGGRKIRIIDDESELTPQQLKIKTYP